MLRFASGVLPFGLGVLALLVTGAPPVSAAGETPVAQRFLDEAPRAWQAYLKRMKRLQGSVENTQLTSSPDGPGSRVSAHLEFRQSGPNFRYLEQKMEDTVRPSYLGTIQVINPRYQFELSRSRSEAPWSISQVAEQLPMGEGYWTAEQKIEWISRFGITPSSLSIRYMKLLTEDECFKLVDAVTVEQGGQELVRVHFTYHPQDPFRTQLRGGWVLLDPEQSWVFRKYALELEVSVAKDKTAPQTWEADFHYQPRAAGDVPLPSRIVQRFEAPNRAWKRVITMDLCLEERDVAEGDFTLQAFGFPEPLQAAALQRHPWPFGVRRQAAALGDCFLEGGGSTLPPR